MLRHVGDIAASRALHRHSPSLCKPSKIRENRHKYSKVGEQITVEQLTELSIVMKVSRYDHVYRHHVRDK